MKTLATTEAPEPTEPITKRRLAKPAILVGLGVAALVTLYLLTMTVTWGLHYRSLTGDKADLTAQLDAEKAIVASQADELTTKKADLDDGLFTVSKFASDKAKYQDHTVIYRYNDQGLSDCADARLEIQSYVKTRYLWQPGPLRAWDSDVTDYCNTVVTYFTDNVAGEEAS